jgi:hypothetical protein
MTGGCDAVLHGAAPGREGGVGEILVRQQPLRAEREGQGRGAGQEALGLHSRPRRLMIDRCRRDEMKDGTNAMYNLCNVQQAPDWLALLVEKKMLTIRWILELVQTEKKLVVMFFTAKQTCEMM